MKHVVDAKQIARSVEDQISDEYIRRTRDYDLTIVSGTLVGRVNGLAVVGNDAYCYCDRSSEGDCTGVH